MKKILTALIVILLLGLSSWKLYEKLTSDKDNQRNVTREKVHMVGVQPVRIGSISDTGEFRGSLKPASQFVVTSKVSGRLKKLFVDMGKRVKKGQLIAIIEDDEFIQKFEQAKAELNVARAELEKSQKTLELAGREVERARLLREKKIISEAELDEIETGYASKLSELNVRKAELIKKESALKMAELELGYTQIRALWEGEDNHRVIAERFVDESSMLQVNTPVVSVIDIDHLVAEIHVSERQYIRLRPLQDVTVTVDALPGKSFSGKIKRISPFIKEASREAVVEIDIPNPDGLLKPGMFIRVRIEFEHHKDITLVPLSSLIRLNGKEGVFVIDEERMEARFIPLKLGIKDAHYAEVIEPPLSGLVVTLGQHLLKDGSPVIIKSKERPSELTNSTGEKIKEGLAR